MPASRRCSAPKSTAAGRSPRATAQARVTRRYRPNTLILETRFECSEGAVTLVDFMPLHGDAFERGPSRGRRARPRDDVHRAGAPLRLRRDRSLGHAARRRHAARHRRPRHGGAANAGAPHRREPDDRRRVHRRGGRDGAVRAHLCRPRICRRRSRSIRDAALEATESFWTELVEEMPAARTLLGCVSCAR